MIIYTSISSFRKRLEDLSKVRKGVYAGGNNEICSAFKNATIEQIRSNRDLILMDSNAVIIKLRLPDKKQHLSKSEGFRLIYLALKHIELVAFLDIYPNRGPLQQISIDANQLQTLLNEFVIEAQGKLLVKHNIMQDLAVME